MPDEDVPRPDTQPSRWRAFGSHVLQMPRWHKRLLVLATILFAGGAAGQIAGYFTAPPPRPAEVRVDESTLGKSLVETPRAQPESDPDPSPTLTERLSPWATKVGSSFMVGFIIGWIFRAFLKVATLLAAGAFALFMGASYFLGIDTSGAEKQYNSAIHWLTTQGYNVANTILEHLPGSISSGAGIFIGFRRK